MLVSTKSLLAHWIIVCQLLLKLKLSIDHIVQRSHFIGATEMPCLLSLLVPVSKDLCPYSALWGEHQCQLSGCWYCLNANFWAIVASLVAQKVEHLSAMWEPQVRSLGLEDPLEKEMATHSSILACKILWTEEPDGPWRLQIVGHNWVTSTMLSEQLKPFLPSFPSQWWFWKTKKKTSKFTGPWSANG